MREQAENKIRELTELWNRQEIDALVALLDDVEIDATRRVLNPAHYAGPEGVRQMVQEILEIWDAWSIELGRFWWNGDQVVVEGEVTARGKGSGVQLRDTYYAIWVTRDGRLVKQVIFSEPDEAFEAAGLPVPEED